MKQNFKKVALLAALSLVAVSCNKEDDVLPFVGSHQTMDTIQVVYSINGEIYQTSFAESEWNIFIERMLALAREGYEVTFSKNGSFLTSQSKEVVTFVTNSADEAHAWSHDMTNAGYTVTISFDKKTGLYTCIAVK